MPDELRPVRGQDAREELLLAEVDLAKAQAEGPASHRKRDYIDKATKEVSSAACLRDLQVVLTAKSPWHACRVSE